jgi:hypothetical protein
MNKIFILFLCSLFLLPSVFGSSISSDDFECDGFNCGSGWNGAWAYSGTCEIVGVSSPIGSYHMRGVSGCNAMRQFDDSGYDEVLVSFYATASSLENGDYCYYYYNDGSSDHLLLTLTNGDDDGIHDYYEFDVTGYGLDAGAGIKMVGASSTGDYCYIDSISISGSAVSDLNIFSDNYNLGETVQIEMSSSVTDASHTVEVYDSSDNLFCSDVIISPSVPYTSFYTTCTMPTTQQTDAYAKLYLTSTPSTSTTQYFNVTPIIQDDNMLQIKKAYFSPQVLQGGSTEIFILVKKDSTVAVDSSTLQLQFPDNTTRILSMEPTINLNEYRGFVTDTYQIGNVTFIVRVEGNGYYDTYTNKYFVAGYNINFVELVNQVSEVLKVREVDELLEPALTVHGTEYETADDAKIWVQLLDDYGDSVDDAICYINIYTPDNSENLQVDNAQMSINGQDGIYYYDLVAPTQQGVYPASVLCYFDATIKPFNVSSFSILYGSQQNDYTYTWVEDSSNHIIKEDNVGGTKRLSFFYNVSNFCPFYDSDLLSSITIYAKADWASNTPNDVITLWVWNYSSSEWIEAPNTIQSQVTGYQTVTNSFSTDNYTKSGFTTVDGGSIRVKLNDTYLADTSNDNLGIDRFYASCDTLANPDYQEVKGSGELHVSAPLDLRVGPYTYYLDSGEKTNKTYRKDFIYHYTIGSAVAEYKANQHIYLTLYKQFRCGYVFNVTELYINGSSEALSYTTTNDDNGRCEVDITHDLSPNTNYNIQIHTENWWIVDLDRAFYSASLQYEMIQIACINYQLSNNLNNFTIPINMSYVLDGQDSLYLSCLSYMDTHYFFDEQASIFESFARINYNFTNTQMKFLEEEWDHLKELEYDLDKYASVIYDGLNLGNSYSVALIQDPYPPSNPNYAKYFANISSSYLTFLRTYAIPPEVWAQANRQLTNFTFDVTNETQVWEYYNRTLSTFNFNINSTAVINNTAVAESVWHNYNGTIIDNILDQIADKIWQFLGTRMDIIT